MPTITTEEGLALVCDEKGRSDGHPALLLHGLSQNAGVWTETASALAPRFRVLVPELRGHGSSGRTEEPDDYTVVHLVSDAELVCETLGLRGAVLCGHGLGGTVALRLALSRPDLVSALVLVSTLPRPLEPSSGPARIRTMLADVVAERGMEAAWNVYVDDGLVGWELDRVPGEVVEGWRQEFLRTAPAAFVGLSRDAAEQEDLGERVGELDVPVLVVVGEDDAAYGPGGRELAEAIPGAELAVIERGGHSPQLARAETFNATVVDFLKRSV